MYSIGEIISTYRKKKGLLQQDLADELAKEGITISYKAISNWERNLAEPSVTIFYKVCRILGITKLKICAEKLLEQRDKMIFVYGTGFSGTVATYLTQKLVNMGILCFSATGGDSVGIFENTLDRMGMFFCISKSGETSMVRDKIKTAQENGVCTVAITGEQENSVGRYADLWFRVENQWKLDDQNTMPNTFFPQVMMLIELIAYEYRRLCMENGIK